MPFWGVLLRVTQKQALRLGKTPPVSPRGMERTAACRAAGSPCQRLRASLRERTPDRSGHPGFDGCLAGFVSLLPGGRHHGHSPHFALCFLMWRQASLRLAAWMGFADAQIPPLAPGSRAWGVSGSHSMFVGGCVENVCWHVCT